MAEKVRVFCTILVLAAGPALGQEWSIEAVDTGTKPDLVVDARGRPHITYMIEDLAGGVFYGVRDEGGWVLERVSSGYFYAPMSLILDAQGRPNIVYHDHQADFFDPNLGAGVYALKRGASWTLEEIDDPGHDFWDISIAITPEGEIHVVGIDPVQFGGVTGVEHAVRNGGSWDVDVVGSGPIPYEFGTDLVADEQGRLHLVFHKGSGELNPNAGLFYAFYSGGDWEIQEVDSEGDVGKFASLALDSQDRPHIAYLDWDQPNSGYLKYAFWDGSAWQRQRVDRLEDIEIGFLGARKMMTLVLDSQDRPHIAYSDRQILKYTVEKNGVWESQEVAGPSGAGVALGQFTSLGLDRSGRPHIAYYELPRRARSSTGTIMYALGPQPPPLTAVLESADLSAVPGKFQLRQNFPNPFNASTTIRFSLPREAEVRLEVFDVSGRRVETLARGRRARGEYQITWDGRDARGHEVATGVYFTRLRAGDFRAIKKMLLLR